MRLYRHLYLLLTLPLLFCGCVKDIPQEPVPEVTSVFPFSVTVMPEPGTRASFDGTTIDAGQYVFATGDKLYVTGGGGKISGELALDSGAGTGTGVFSGDLSITGGYEPTASTALSATLVGASQSSGFFTISDHKITDGPIYPATIANTTLEGLVQNYSHFTSSFTFAEHQITLTQQTVFLNFALELFKTNLTGSPTEVDINVKSSDGSTLLRTVTDVPVGGSSTIARINFTTVFPAGNDLRDAQIWIDNGSGIQCLPNFASDLTLEANKYYRVARSVIDDFTIEAPSSGTGTTVTFNYTPVQYKVYSGGSWTDWADYSTAISLAAGEKVSFRGQLTSYANNGGSTPLFTSANNVYIYGDMMSLICDENYVRRTAVGEKAFFQAFKNCDRVNIHPDKELILSAETLGTSCCESMFEGCTSLTKTPMLLATTLADMCYNKMFKGCSALESLPEGLLPATTLAFGCYAKMFHGCSNLTTVPSTLLPATTLAKACYNSMFFNCTKLTAAPDLPATDPQSGCYFAIFRHCHALTSVKCLIYVESKSVDQPSGYDGSPDPEASNMKNWDEINLWTVFNKWMNDVGNDSNRTFTRNPSMTYSRGNQVGQIPNNWEIITAQ